MFLSREQVRQIDHQALEGFGVPGIVLMENAGRGAAEVLVRLGVQGPVLICCGKGNNGGDGLVMARHLDRARVKVRVLLFADPKSFTGDAAINFHIVERSGIPLAIHSERSIDGPSLGTELATVDWVVDALFGTGLQGPVRSPFDQVIAAINASHRRVLAVDIPSGLDADTGLPLGPTIRAEHTVTFVAEKIGFAQPSAKEWLGTVHVVDIGAPRILVKTTSIGASRAP